MKKILAATIGVLLIAAACNKQAAVQPAPQPVAPNDSTDQMVNWKTYTNQEYEFEFKYPVNLAVDETKAGDGSDFKRLTIARVDTPNNIILNKNMNATEGMPAFLEIHGFEIKNPKNQITNDCKGSLSSEVTTIGGISITKCIGESMQGLGSMSSSFTRNKIIYYSIVSERYSGNDKKLIDQILSTFKFTSPQTTTKVQNPPAESGISGLVTMTTCGGAAPPPGAPPCRDWTGPVYMEVKNAAGVSQYLTTNSDGKFKIALKPGNYTILVGGTTTAQNNTVTVVSGKYTTINPHFTILAP